MNRLLTFFQSRPPEEHRPDYYITPTRDFTQYTRDCEEKYWSKDTAFDWSQDIRKNLEENLENLPAGELMQLCRMVLPMVGEAIRSNSKQIIKHGLPCEEDALKAIAECLPAGDPAIAGALQVLAPLKQIHLPSVQFEDNLEILGSELIDLREQQRLGLFMSGAEVRACLSDAEKSMQQDQIISLEQKILETRQAYDRLRQKTKVEEARVREESCRKLKDFEASILHHMEATGALIRDILASDALPGDPGKMKIIKDLILHRQLRGLKDVANHALVVEQSAIAPLTMGIIHYKRHREIQEALTTFVNDEAKHSATFHRYLVEKLEAREFVSSLLIDGANKYMWMARFFPGLGMFLAVIVEAIGAATLEFFGNEKYMPDRLFQSISHTISQQDEKRHMDLCVAIYNELFRKGTRWERWRNKMSLNKIMQSVYGDKTEDHRLIQAFRAFGVESEYLFRHVVQRLSQQLTRISVYIEPDEIMQMIKGR